MTSDEELLARFLENRSESAFTALVQRYLPLVRTTALRRVGGDAHAADDVTQQVFVALARKAPVLRGHTTLAGWLYTSTHHATAAWVRGEQRRKQREARASSMSSPESAMDNIPDPAQLRPILDDALVALKPDEREAIVLRFFSGQSFAQIGVALTISEEAARKRVDRALLKLHAVLLRRGVASTLGGLGGALTAAGIQPVPAGLAVQVAGAVLAKTATPGLLASAAAAFWPAAAAATLVGGAFVIIPQNRVNTEGAAALAARQSHVAHALATTRAENEQLERELHAVRRDEAQRPVAASARAPSPPVTPTGTPARPAGVQVSVTPQGAVSWNGELIRLDEFLARLLEHQAAAPAGESRLIVTAPGARFPQLNWVIDEARKVGIAHLLIDSDAAPIGEQSTWF